ncbi:MAG TPA: hypothetical protein VI039_04265 [Solirubrobacterales bacterium]
MRPWLLVPLCLLAAIAGCGADDGSPTRGETASPRESPNSGPSRGLAGGEGEETITPAVCPAGHPACRVATGRIVYVERVDPDGDGDAHFVIADPQGISLPGLTAIDVRVGLRPQPLPGRGDLISAAGPVQTGSYGQDQIHALELNVAR